ncbi:MAG: Ubiquinone/menaquinone biosynthesis C-methyltransferase UbiE [Anaerolineae bacterium]|nr:Ubiquinone/menaquinone biosynthesis C-methyltransferase UbiE [Anaerolineae bacterium]
MTESSANPAWLEEETARRYQLFTQKTGMYQELSAEMVRLAQLRPGQRVLDVGCGTGVTTHFVLPKIGPTGCVIALDVSAPMLAVARQQISAPNVTFVAADAAEAAGYVSPPVDRIVCNSVFWQFRHKVEVLAALRQVLSPDGLLLFNAPEPYFIFQDIPRSPKVSVLFKQLAAERYGVGPQDLRTIGLFLRHCGFELLATHEFTRTRSAEESYLFFQLPVATAWMDPPLDYPTRMALLEEARQLAEPDQVIRQRWMYFVARPVV